MNRRKRVQTMSNREMALEFVRRFCAGDINGLKPLLADDLQFSGPFHRFATRDAYLETLMREPLDDCGYRVLSVTEGDDSVSIYYDYEKPDRTVTIAQLCTIKDHEICKILIVFDGRGFA